MAAYPVPHHHQQTLCERVCVCESVIVCVCKSFAKTLYKFKSFTIQICKQETVRGQHCIFSFLLDPLPLKLFLYLTWRRTFPFNV